MIQEESRPLPVELCSLPACHATFEVERSEEVHNAHSLGTSNDRREWQACSHERTAPRWFISFPFSKIYIWQYSSSDSCLLRVRGALWRRYCCCTKEGHIRRGMYDTNPLEYTSCPMNYKVTMLQLCWMRDLASFSA